MAPFRAYVRSDVPLEGQSEVIVTNASMGPSKFSIQLKKSNWEYQRMRSELESTPLCSLPAPPDKGTPCIAVKSEKLHRGLVLCTNQDQNSSNVCFMDFGNIETLPNNMLFQVPDRIMAYRLFSITVALAGGEALSQKPGLNEVFATLVPSLDHLMCEVVGTEATHQTINLYDVKGQNIAEVVLRMYENLVPKLKALPPAPPATPKIEIPDPQLNSIEKLFIMVSHRVGHFYGQLLSRPTSELSDIFSELNKYYEANPEAPRLDSGTSVGQIAVVKWAQDGQYYRCRIRNESINCVEIQFVDFGDVITVSRRDLLAPVVSDWFSQPAFGINCILSRDGAALLKKEDWDAALLEKSVEVRIVNKNPDGTYTVAFTIDSFNHKVLDVLYPPTNPAVARQEPMRPPIQPLITVPLNAQVEPTRPPVQPPITALKAQVEPIRPPIQPPIMAPMAQVEPTRPPVQPPITAPKAQMEPKRTPIQPPPTTISTETRSMNKPAEEWSVKKPPARPIYVPPNNRTSQPAKDPFVHRLAASSVAQEIVRTPRGPPSSGTQRGFVRPEPAAPNAPEAVQPVERAPSSIPTIPVPTGTYAFLDTAHQRVTVAWFYSFERFFLTPMDVTTYEAELEPLNGFYASLSANELVEDSPKVGLPCVVKFMDDGVFYRSQIVAILPDQTAQILFVDYGNEQLTPLKDIKRIVPKFMKLPQLVWPCKLAGIDGSHLRSDATLSSDDELIASFLSVDKGVHLVKVVHKTHGDMATYITKKSVPHPAIAQLRDRKHPLRADGYDVYVSFVKSSSEFWIQLKEDEQIVNDVGEELAQHIEKRAARVDRPIVGQVYTMELPDIGGYYRAQVCSVDGKMVHATFIDYGDAHPVSIEKIFTLPDRLGALPPLAMRCSMSRQNWPLEAEVRFVKMTSDQSLVFRAVLQSTSNGGVSVVDSISLDGMNIELESFAGLDVVPKNEQPKVEFASPLSQKINVPEPSPVLKDVFPRPAVCALFDPSIQMHAKEHEVYISFTKSHSEFWVQLKADEDLINKVSEELVQHMKKAPPRVERPVIGQIYAMEHPTLGGHYRARVSTITGDMVEASFVDYGDVLPVSIQKIFVPPASLEALPPLAAWCRMKCSRKWSQEAEERFVSITSDIEAVFRISLGPIVHQSVCEVEAIFLNGKNIEEDIFPKEVEEQKPEPTAPEVIELVAELEEAFIQPSITDLRDPVGHDVFVSFVNSPSDFWIQLKADEDAINKVLDDLKQELERDKQPIVVDQLYAVEHPTIGGKFRARITSVDGADAQAFFVDYGDEFPVPIGSIFILPERLRLLPPLATRCKMDRQEWLPDEKKKFVSITADPDNVYRAIFGAIDDYGVRRVYSLFLDGKNIEDDIFPEPENKENVGPARTECQQPTATPVTPLPVILEAVEPVQINDKVVTGSSTDERKVLPRPAISDLYCSGTRQLEGYQVYICRVNSPSDFHVQMKADEDLIYTISCELEQYVKNGAALVERPVVDQLYAMEHPTLGSFYRVRITPMLGGAVEACFVEYGETHLVQTPKIYTLPEHLKWLPFLAARCSMKRDEWTPEAKDRFVVVASDMATVFRAVFDAVEENGTCRIASLFLDDINIEDAIFPGLAEDAVPPNTVQDPVVEETNPALPSGVDDIEPQVEERAIRSLQADPELCSGLEGDSLEVGEATRSLKPDPELSSRLEGVELQVEGSGSTPSLQSDPESCSDLVGVGPQVEDDGADRSLQTELVNEVMMDSKLPLGEMDETFTRPAQSESTVQPAMVEVVDSSKDEAIAFGKRCSQEPSLDEEKPVDSIAIGNLIAFDDGCHSMQDVKAAPLIDLITAPLEPVPQDPIMIPVFQVLEGGSTSSSVVETRTIEEDQTGSNFVADEPSILTTETAPIGSVSEESQVVPIVNTGEPSTRIAMEHNNPAEEQEAVSNEIMEEPSFHIDMEVTISVEVERQAATIPIEGKQEDVPNTVESGAVQTDVEKPAAPVLIEIRSDPVAATTPLVDEEENIPSVLKEETPSDPAVIELIFFDEGVDKKPSTLVQVVEEVAAGADGELKNPARFEEKGQSVDLESIKEAELVSSRADLLVEENPAPAQHVGVVTIDIEEERVIDPVVAAPVLLTPFHFGVSATEKKLAESASPVTEETAIDSQFEIDLKMTEESFKPSFLTPDRSILDESTNCDTFSVSMICHNGDDKTEDEELTSLPEFTDDSLITELLNGFMGSQRDCKTAVGTNLFTTEETLGAIAGDSISMSSGGQGDDQLAFIPEGSEFVVEAQLDGEPVEEP